MKFQKGYTHLYETTPKSVIRQLLIPDLEGRGPEVSPSPELYLYDWLSTS